jgi:two-component system cell cycle sensor histidine kinase/response regulator CckA
MSKSDPESFASPDEAPRRGRGRPPRDPSIPPRDPGVIGGRDAGSLSHAILDSLPAHIAVIERDGRVVAVNKAWERFALEAAADVPGAPGLGGNYLDAVEAGAAYERSVAVEGLAGLHQVLDRARSRYEIEYPLELKGTRRWFHLVATPLLVPQGGAVISHFETTERRQAEEANDDQQRMLQAVLESTADGVVVADRDGQFVLFNRAARELAGVGILQGDPSRWSETYGLFQPDRVTPLRLEELPLYRAIQGESTDDVRIFLKNPAIPGGRFLLLSGRPWTTPGGERRGGVVVFRDITADVLAEEQSRLQIQVLDSVPLAVVALDPEGGIVYWNIAAEQLLGWSAAELVGRRGRDVLLDEGQRAQVDGIRAYLLAGRPYRGEFKVKKPDGTVVPVLASVTARWRADGTLEGFVAVGVDLTDMHMTQQALRGGEYEMRQFQKMEAIGRLAGGIAHDFNNLLTVIRGYTDILLRRMPAGEPLRVEVEQVSRAVDRAAELTSQLLAFARRQPLAPTLISLNTVVSDFMPMLRRTLGEDIRVKVELDPDLGLARADATQMGQVLLNVVLNARDAMPDGGELTITTRDAELDATFPGAHAPLTPGPYVQLSIGDTGSGMDEGVKARVFEPFFTTKEVGQGSGLGLSTAYGIVRQMGGQIWLYSEPGRGTTFKIYLPRVFETEVAAPPPPPPGPGPIAPATLLVVEDDPGVRSIERRLLELAGHLVLEAEDYDSALELVRAYTAPIDLVLCDVVLPGRGGHEVVEAIRRLRPEVRALFVSGHARDVAARMGATADHPFLQKPFSAAELNAAVREALVDSPRSRSEA